MVQLVGVAVTKVQKWPFKSFFSSHIRHHSFHSDTEYIFTVMKIEDPLCVDKHHFIESLKLFMKELEDTEILFILKTEAAES